MRSHRILPVAYDGNGFVDSNIVGANSEAFSSKKRFILLSGKPIPKHSKSYMEFTITYHPTNKNVRHIPFYVGIHKEPSLGILVSDFSLGCIYYCNKYKYKSATDYIHPLNFQAIERYNFNASLTITPNTQKLKAKVPLLNTVVGIGVDTSDNRIDIYSDGKLFYSFKPQAYTIDSNPGDFFFCIANLLDNEPVKGRVNYGRGKMKYKPMNYWSLYDYYYDKLTASDEIKGKCHYGTIYTNPPIEYNFDSKIDAKNSIAPVDPVTRKRDPYLIYSDPALQYTTTKSMVLRNNPNDIATLCWPIPTDQKIYMELSTQGCVFKKNAITGLPDYLGVPVIFGITEKVNNTTKNSYSIELDHKIHVDYYTHSTVAGVTTDYKIKNLLTPVIPIQPQAIGLMIDLEHNKIEIYTNGDLFCTITITGTDFSNPSGLFYFFIKPHDTSFIVDPMAADKEHTILNTGDTPFAYKELVDNRNVMSYYYYYNYTIKEWISAFFDCTITTKPYKLPFGRNIPAVVYVPPDENDDWSPGLNMLWDTYNIVSDEEPHNNDRDISSFDMAKLLEAEELTNKR